MSRGAARRGYPQAGWKVTRREEATVRQAAEGRTPKERKLAGQRSIDPRTQRGWGGHPDRFVRNCSSRGRKFREILTMPYKEQGLNESPSGAAHDVRLL